MKRQGHHQYDLFHSRPIPNDHCQSFKSALARRTLTEHLSDSVSHSSPKVHQSLDITMVRYIASVIVPYPRSKVFPLLADWRNLAIWDLNITSSVYSPDQSNPTPGVGTRYDVRFSANGLKDVPVDYVCTEYVSPERCSYTGIARFFKSQDSIVCEDAEDGNTKVTAEFNLGFRGILAPLSFVMNGAMQSTGPIVMKDIEKFVKERLDESG